MHFAKCDKCNTSHSLIDGRKGQLWRIYKQLQESVFQNMLLDTDDLLMWGVYRSSLKSPEAGAEQPW